MVEQKEIDNKKLDEVKNEKPVAEVKDSEDVDKVDDKKKDEGKKEDKKEKVEANKGPKKTEAVVNGRDLRISTKHAVAVSNFIKNKNVEDAIGELEEVSKMKKAIPMRGEIPHRKGKGMMSGRYPVTAVNEFLVLLKSLKANAINNELELEKVKLHAMPNVASRPVKRFGKGKHKRTHVQIKLVPMAKEKK